MRLGFFIGFLLFSASIGLAVAAYDPVDVKRISPIPSFEVVAYETPMEFPSYFQEATSRPTAFLPTPTPKIDVDAEIEDDRRYDNLQDSFYNMCHYDADLYGEMRIVGPRELATHLRYHVHDYENHVEKNGEYTYFVECKNLADPD